MTSTRRRWISEAVGLLIVAAAFLVMARTIADFNWVLAFLLFVAVRTIVAGLTFAYRARRGPVSAGNAETPR